MQTSKQDAAKSKVPTSHPPERRAKLWQILPNGRPYTRKSQNQLELPPGPVLRAWTAQARNNFLRENTEWQRHWAESALGPSPRMGRAAKGWEGDVRVSLGCRWAQISPLVPPTTLRKPLLLEGARFIKHLRGSVFPSNPADIPKTLSENAGPGLTSLIS